MTPGPATCVRWASAPGDVLIAVAASGTTPCVLAAVAQARAAGALTVELSKNPGTPLLSAVDRPVLLDTGAEVISGSTRLKAGTAQKIALNILSSALMVALGKVYGNLMVDLRASDAKPAPPFGWCSTPRPRQKPRPGWPARAVTPASRWAKQSDFISGLVRGHFWRASGEPAASALLQSGGRLIRAGSHWRPENPHSRPIAVPEAPRPRSTRPGLHGP